MYDEAQLQIYTLMQRDSYPRFVNSQMFKTLVQQTEKKAKDKVSVRNWSILVSIFINYISERSLSFYVNIKALSSIKQITFKFINYPQAPRISIIF